jgi:hypothetical protein
MLEIDDDTVASFGLATASGTSSGDHLLFDPGHSVGLPWLASEAVVGHALSLGWCRRQAHYTDLHELRRRLCRAVQGDFAAARLHGTR